MKTKQEIESYWTEKATDVLHGRTIIKVRYLKDSEMEMLGWCKRPICVILDNGTILIPSMDDEGNNGGSVFFQKRGEDIDVLPVV